MYMQFPLSTLRCNNFTIHVECFLFIIRAAAAAAIRGSYSGRFNIVFLSGLHTAALTFTSPQLLYSGDATLHLRVNVSARVKLRSCVSSGYGSSGSFQNDPTAD